MSTYVYRVEIEEHVTTTRETYVEASSEEEARQVVEKMDWRTFNKVETSLDNSIVFVEKTDRAPLGAA